MGFSGSILSLIFSTLKALKYSGEILIVENMKVQDEVSFECDIPYDRIGHKNFKPMRGDTFGFSLMRPAFKQTVFEQFKDQHQISKSQYVNILHPSLLAASNCSLDTGIYMEPACVISPYAQLGFGVSVNRGCTLGHHTVVQDFATLNPGVHIAGHCNIGSASSIGIGTTILDHTSVGNNTTIGAGSVVTRDIPAGVLAYGNPCKIIKENP